MADICTGKVTSLRTVIILHVKSALASASCLFRMLSSVNHFPLIHPHLIASCLQPRLRYLESRGASTSSSGQGGAPGSRVPSPARPTSLTLMSAGSPPQGQGQGAKNPRLGCHRAAGLPRSNTGSGGGAAGAAHRVFRWLYLGFIYSAGPTPAGPLHSTQPADFVCV